MTNNIIEDGRAVADEYWPYLPGKKIRLDNGMTVTLNSERRVEGCYKRSLSVEYNGNHFTLVKD